YATPRFAELLPTNPSGTLASGDTGTFSETYDNPNVGTTHVLTPTGTIKNGSSVDVTANYNITFTPINTGVISQRAITVTATFNSRPYDGTILAAARTNVV